MKKGYPKGEIYEHTPKMNSNGKKNSQDHLGKEVLYICSDNQKRMEQEDDIKAILKCIDVVSC